MVAETLNDEVSRNVIRQVEFYFSDSNLPRDKFLMTTVNESEDGMVSLALICSFARMRNHLGLGFVKPEEVPGDLLLTVSETLRKSSFLKVSDDGKKVGRNSKLSNPEEISEEVDSRTLAVAPFEYNAELEDVESFFSQFGKVNSLRLPCHVSDRRFFCGSALVEFSTVEDANKFRELKLSYAGAELEINSKKDFDSERKKTLEYDDRRGPHGKNSHESDSYPKGLIIAFKLQRIPKDEFGEDDLVSVEEAKGNANALEPQSTCEGDISNGVKGSLDSLGDQEEDSKTNGNLKEQTEDISEERGENVSNPEDIATDSVTAQETQSTVVSKDAEQSILREDIKKIFQKFGNVKYVDYSMGQDSGYIRYENPEAGQKARAFAALAQEGGLVIRDHIAVLEPVTGESEREYWEKLCRKKINYYHRKEDKGHGRPPKGRHFNKKHIQSDPSGCTEERPRKAQKVEV